MKTVFLFLLLLWQVSLLGQVIDSLGLGDNKYLNRQELVILNQELKDQKKIFDFTNKKLAFIGGNAGNIIWTKKMFFDLIIKPINSRKDKMHPYIVILTKEEKERSGGYDALIMQPPMIFRDKQKLKIITEIKTAR